MIRTKPPKMEKKKKKKKIKVIEETKARTALINHVLIYHSYWASACPKMTNEFLLAHSHQDQREELKRQLEKEGYIFKIIK